MKQDSAARIVKTPFGTRAHARIAEANDLVCFFAFQCSEFEQAIGTSHHSLGARTVFQVYPRNPHAPRIDVTTDRLPDLNASALASTLQMGIVWSVEHALEYARSIRAEARRYGLSPAHTPPDPSEEDKLEALLSISGVDASIRSVCLTIGFFRHARNVIAHAYEAPTPQFERFQRLHGSALDKFWASTSANLLGLQFSKFNPNSFGVDECLGAINSIRISVSRSDEVIASLFPLERLSIGTIRRLVDMKPALRGDNQRIARKVEGYLKNEYGLLVTDGAFREHTVELARQLGL